LEQTGSRRLLVVSDEPGMAGIVQRHAGDNVIVAAVEYAGVSQACAETPDAMVFDVPGHLGQGYEALKLLQTMREDHPALPVLVLVWQPLTQPLSDRVLVLQKPIQVGALRDAVGALMRGAQ